MIATISLAVIVAVEAYSCFRLHRLNSDLIEIAAQSHADTLATLLNAALTKTPAEFLRAQQITTETSTETPRQAAKRAEEQAIIAEINRRTRQLGYEPPDAPDGL